MTLECPNYQYLVRQPTYLDQKFSRLFGTKVGIDIPKDCVKIINISFVRDGSETSKYLTYINSKGELISKEYTDYGLLEGAIKWKGFKESMLSK